MKSKLWGILGLIIFLFSVTPVLATVDLAVESVSVSPSTIYANETATITIVMNNSGNESVSDGNLSLKVYRGSTLTDEADVTNLGFGVGDERTETFSWTPELAGSYSIEAAIAVANDNNSANDEKSTSTTVSSRSGYTYSVDVTLTPELVELNAGDSRDFTVRVRNTGNDTDTYDLSVETDSGISSWFDFDDSTLEVEPGEEETTELNVDVPDGAYDDDYLITVWAKGVSNDSDTAALIINEQPNLLDVRIRNVRLSPSMVEEGQSRAITVTADVSFVSYEDDDDKDVTMELYVNDEHVDTQDYYFVSGQTRQVKMYAHTTEDPIDMEPGKYNLYFKAFVGSKELQEGPGAVLEVKYSSRIGSQNGRLDGSQSNDSDNGNGNGDGIGPDGVPYVVVDVQETSITTKPGENFSLNITITNNEYHDEIYDIYSQVLELGFRPSEVAVRGGYAKTLIFEVSVPENATPGNYTARVFAEDFDARGYDELEVIVEEEGGIGAGVGAGVTGFVTFIGGGGLAALIGAIILAVLLGYYYYSKQDEEAEEEDEGTLPVTIAPTQPPSESPITVPIRAAPSIEVVREVPMERQWTMNDAKRVLGDSGRIKSDFGNTLGEAKSLKSNINGFTYNGKAIELHSPWTETPKVSVHAAKKVLKDAEKVKNDLGTTLKDAKKIKKKIRKTAKRAKSAKAGKKVKDKYVRKVVKKV